MTTGYNAFHVLKWALDMLATQVNLEVTEWYNVGFLLRDLRLDFLDMFDIDADARIPITRIGFGSDWNNDYASMADVDFKIPTDVQFNFFDMEVPCNLLLLLVFPIMILIPLALRELKVPSSELMPGRAADSPGTKITGLTEGYSWEDALATIIAVVIIVLVGGGLAIFVPKMAGTFMNKVFGGFSKNYLKDIYEDLQVSSGTSVNEKLVALQSKIDTVNTEVDGIKADLDVGEESLTAQLTALSNDIAVLEGQIYAAGKEHNLRSQVVYMRKYTEAILQYLMDPMGSARPNANEASFWIET